MGDPYTKQTTYTFAAAGEIWEVLSFSKTWIDFAETEKNGHEDDHISGRAVLIDGSWRCDHFTQRMLGLVREPTTAAELEAFFNTHGVPTR